MSPPENPRDVGLGLLSPPEPPQTLGVTPEWIWGWGCCHPPKIPHRCGVRGVTPPKPPSSNGVGVVVTPKPLPPRRLWGDPPQFPMVMGLLSPPNRNGVGIIVTPKPLPTGCGVTPWIEGRGCRHPETPTLKWARGGHTPSPQTPQTMGVTPKLIRGWGCHLPPLPPKKTPTGCGGDPQIQMGSGGDP